jgi:hypothetical protein
MTTSEDRRALIGALDQGSIPKLFIFLFIQ